MDHCHSGSLVQLESKSRFRKSLFRGREGVSSAFFRSHSRRIVVMSGCSALKDLIGRKEGEAKRERIARISYGFQLESSFLTGATPALVIECLPPLILLYSVHPISLSPRPMVLPLISHFLRLLCPPIKR